MVKKKKNLWNPQNNKQQEKKKTTTTKHTIHTQNTPPHTPSPPEHTKPLPLNSVLLGKTEQDQPSPSHMQHNTSLYLLFDRFSTQSSTAQHHLWQIKRQDLEWKANIWVESALKPQIQFKVMNIKQCHQGFKQKSLNESFFFKPPCAQDVQTALGQGFITQNPFQVKIQKILCDIHLLVSVNHTDARFN